MTLCPLSPPPSNVNSPRPLKHGSVNSTRWKLSRTRLLTSIGPRIPSTGFTSTSWTTSNSSEPWLTSSKRNPQNQGSATQGPSSILYKQSRYGRYNRHPSPYHRDRPPAPYRSVPPYRHSPPYNAPGGRALRRRPLHTPGIDDHCFNCGVTGDHLWQEGRCPGQLEIKRIEAAKAARLNKRYRARHPASTAKPRTVRAACAPRVFEGSQRSLR